MSTQQVGQPRKRRRVFLWFFLAVQVIFIIWLITGLVSTGHTAPSHASLVAACDHNQWYPLFKSMADCMRTTARTQSDAAGAGRGLGAALIIVIWLVVDLFLAIFYGIYRLARRPGR